MSKPCIITEGCVPVVTGSSGNTDITSYLTVYGTRTNGKVVFSIPAPPAIEVENAILNITFPCETPCCANQIIHASFEAANVDGGVVTLAHGSYFITNITTHGFQVYINFPTDLPTDMRFSWIILGYKNTCSCDCC